MASLIKAIANKPEVLILLLFLLVPGFVFVRAIDTLHPGRRATMGNQIIDVVFWSVAILAVWFMPAVLLFRFGPGLSYGLYPILLFILILLGVFATPSSWRTSSTDWNSAAPSKSWAPSRPRPLRTGSSRVAQTITTTCSFTAKTVRIWAAISERTPLQHPLLMDKRSMSKKSGDWTRMGGLLNGSRGPGALS